VLQQARANGFFPSSFGSVLPSHKHALAALAALRSFAIAKHRHSIIAKHEQDEEQSTEQFGSSFKAQSKHKHACFP
jgi:hypothetical protein